MILWKDDETQRLYAEMIEIIKPYVRYEHDFESLAPYLCVFNEIPSKEKENIIEYFVRLVWGYKDHKRKGVIKKSKTKLKNAINKYQEAIRELHNSDVSDEVIFRNGDVYSYDGRDDFDDDFDINLYLYNLPEKIKENYLTNIEILKDLDYLENLLPIITSSLGLKKPSKDLLMHIYKDFKIINPLDFFEQERTSKNYIKEVLYKYAKQYNIPNYKMKKLIDAI